MPTKEVKRIPDLQHPVPVTRYDWPYQHGIADPFWPFEPDGEWSAADKEIYSIYYSGRVDPQRFVAILRADVLSHDTTQLQQLLKLLTERLHWYVDTKPSQSHVLPFSEKDIPVTYRVTVTLALGSSLFVDTTGYDRFGIHSQRPAFLKPMPGFPGDAPDFQAQANTSDLLIMICSDHPYVNTAVVRDITEKINPAFASKYSYPAGSKIIHIKDVEQGFGRPDRREFLRFDDGIDNLRLKGELEKLVFVNEKDPEPSWCINGSYMVYRKIREKLPIWEAFSTPTQEGMIGREKATGKPLSPSAGYPKDEAPDFGGATNPGKTPFTAHIRKVQPRRPGTDLFGIPDTDRRFLRRPYPFFEGINTQGEFVNGLHFIAFMRSLQHQFEHVTNMWQMNAGFPEAGTGIDAMYAKGVLETVDGGYYFCPPMPAPDDYFASGMFV
ncbi:Dyp-type peroxidase [Paraflavitalea speifideaquila]|uniref:Dyp-type peroxidase n=1 Tax=Paraflavitalea speifideaquila TaxID=3076558 RepID=UPI0028F0797D|nr:Dyp-type peroxidase [Paraflavitalea speifideiaquila]